MTHEGRLKTLAREIGCGVLLALAVSSPTFLAAQGLTMPPDRAASLSGAIGNLIPALQNTPGCLGIEVGSMQSGKQVIFAWFENKKAVLAWYYSDTHRALMGITGRTASSNPLANVPDEVPVLAIASVTLPNVKPGAAPSAADLTNIPQIAIELYTPLPGGLAAGGRFAPATLKVPGLVEAPPAAASGR
jgi:hypothetical protein